MEKVIVIEPEGEAAISPARWRPIIRLLRTYGCELRFLHRLPLEISEDEFLDDRPVEEISELIQHANMLVTCDVSIANIGCASNTPTYFMTKQGTDWGKTFAERSPNLVWVMFDPEQVDPAQLTVNIRVRMAKFFRNQ